MPSLKSIFLGFNLRIAFGFAFLQQSLVAAGTFLMGKIAVDISTSGIHPWEIATLFACLVLPGTLIQLGLIWSQNLALKEAMNLYFQAYIRSNYGRPDIWRWREEKSMRHDILAKSGQDTIQTSVHFFLDVFTTSLNIVLNTISVMLVTTPSLGAVILGAALIGLAIIHFAGPQISLASRQEMLSDSKLNSHLNSSWDNIILGNRLHFDRWLARFHGMFSISREASKTAVLKRDGAAALAGMATNVTVVGFVLGSAWLHRQNTASALALLVMLPRSLQIVLHIQIVQSYWAQWKSLRERLQLVLHGLADPADRSLSPFIQGDKIEILRLEGEQKLNLPELISLMNEKAPRGRVLVTGPNGSGKSTFLLDLKKQSRERSIYLPPQSDLEHSDSSSEFSSGQAMLSLLKDLEKNDAEILLLDEWDANLSDENCLSQERLIERLAETRLVIEIRHGRKNS